MTHADLDRAAASLVAILTDPRPTHALLEAGDLVRHAGTLCDIVRRAGNRLVLAPRDGAPTRIAPARECEPASWREW